MKKKGVKQKIEEFFKSPETIERERIEADEREKDLLNIKVATKLGWIDVRKEFVQGPFMRGFGSLWDRNEIRGYLIGYSSRTAIPDYAGNLHDAWAIIEYCKKNNVMLGEITQHNSKSICTTFLEKMK